MNPERTNTESAADWVNMLAALPDIHTTETADVPTKSGGRYSYTYASLPGIIEQIRPVLAEHGFGVTQNVTSNDRNDPEVTTVFFHKTGDFYSFGPLVMPGGGAAQSIGSAITYARRYALLASLGLAPDEDDDGKAANEATTAQLDSAHQKAWAVVFELFPQDPQVIWYALFEKLGHERGHMLTDIEAKALVEAARELAADE